MPTLRLSIPLLTLLWLTPALADGMRPPAAGHPIIGTWVYKQPDRVCVESYTYRADGTSYITSALEEAETVYEISDAPSALGFYKYSDRLIKDNGKPDCQNQITDNTGETTTRYLRFHPSGDKFLMCAQEDLSKCFGPLERSRDGKPGKS